jgi:hypothetical protein
MNEIDTLIKSTDKKLSISSLVIFGIGVLLFIIFVSLKNFKDKQQAPSGYIGPQIVAYQCTAGDNVRNRMCTTVFVPQSEKDSISPTGPLFDTLENCQQSCTGGCPYPNYQAGDWAIDFLPTQDNNFYSTITQNCPQNPIVPQTTRSFGNSPPGTDLSNLITPNKNTLESNWDPNYNQGLLAYCDNSTGDILFSYTDGSVSVPSANPQPESSLQCTLYHECSDSNQCTDLGYFITNPNPGTAIPGSCQDNPCTSKYFATSTNFFSVSPTDGTITIPQNSSNNQYVIFSPTGQGQASNNPASFCDAFSMYYTGNINNNTCCFNDSDTLDANFNCVTKTPLAVYTEQNGVYGCYETSGENVSPNSNEIYFTSMTGCENFVNNIGLSFANANPNIKGIVCDPVQGPTFSETISSDTSLWPDVQGMLNSIPCQELDQGCNGVNYKSTQDYILLYENSNIPANAEMATSNDLLRMAFDTTITKNVPAWCLGALYNDSGNVMAGYPSNQYSGTSCGNGTSGIINTGSTSNYQWCKLTLDINEPLPDNNYQYAYKVPLNNCYQYIVSNQKCEQTENDAYLMQCSDYCLPGVTCQNTDGTFTCADTVDNCPSNDKFSCSEQGDTICVRGGTLDNCSSCCPAGTVYCKNTDDDTKSSCCSPCSACVNGVCDTNTICGVNLDGCTNIDSLSECVNNSCQLKAGANNVKGKKWTSGSLCPQSINDFNSLPDCDSSSGSGCIYWTGTNIMDTCDTDCTDVWESQNVIISETNIKNNCKPQSILQFAEANSSGQIDWTSVNVCVEKMDDTFKITPCFDINDKNNGFTYNGTNVTCPFVSDTSLFSSLQCDTLGNQLSKYNNDIGLQAAFDDLVKEQSTQFCVMKY